MTKAERLRRAVSEGIAAGWSAKTTAYNTGNTEMDIRRTAYRMKVAFPWERIGVPPAWGNEPIPLSMLYKRHRHSLFKSSRMLKKILIKLGHGHKVAPEILEVINYLRSRTVPERWEKRIKVVKD